MHAACRFLATLRGPSRRLRLPASQSYPPIRNNVSRVVVERRSRPSLWRNHEATIYIAAQPRTPPTIGAIRHNRVRAQPHQVQFGIFPPAVTPTGPVEVS